MNDFDVLWRKFRKSKKYREVFVAAQVKRGIPFQIRKLMKEQQINQGELASRSGLTQGVVSRAADPEYGNLTLNTIIRIAAGFDVAFIGRFVPFSELGRWFINLSDEPPIPRFDVEDANRRDSHGTASTTWVTKSDESAIRKYEEETKRMAAVAGVEMPVLGMTEVSDFLWSGARQLGDRRGMGIASNAFNNNPKAPRGASHPNGAQNSSELGVAIPATAEIETEERSGIAAESVLKDYARNGSAITTERSVNRKKKLYRFRPKRHATALRRLANVG